MYRTSFHIPQPLSQQAIHTRSFFVACNCPEDTLRRNTTSSSHSVRGDKNKCSWTAIPGNTGAPPHHFLLLTKKSQQGVIGNGLIVVQMTFWGGLHDGTACERWKTAYTKDWDTDKGASIVKLSTNVVTEATRDSKLATRSETMMRSKRAVVALLGLVFALFNYTTLHSHTQNITAVPLITDFVAKRAPQRVIPRFLVFYHSYIPPQNTTFALSIVDEQIQQLQKYDVQRVVHVSLGSNHTVCHRFADCRHEHYDQGTELHTLSLLWNHCQNHTNDTVVYIHSKGSFHPKQSNQYWRYYLTEAALACPFLEECNVCGLQWYVTWTQFVPGNMWKAQCRYISRLMNPWDFSVRMQSVAQDLLVDQLRGRLTTDTLTMGARKDFFGLQRYAAEHWMGSHPTVKGCDMDADATIPDEVREKCVPDNSCSLRRWWVAGQSLDAAAAVGPRRHGAPVHDTNASRHPEYNAVTDYYGLRGQLQKWYGLYQEAPPDDSWVWQWYPHGMQWKSLVQKHGVMGAIDRMVPPIDMPLLTSNPNRSEVPPDVESNVSNSTEVAPDVQWFVDAHMDLETDKSMVVRRVTHPFYRGDSLVALYKYCEEQAVDRLVGYWNFTGIDNKIHCSLDAPINWCGKPYCYKTTCGYVQQLLHPVEFVHTWQERVLRPVVLLDIYSNLKFVSKSMVTLGVDAYAIDYWITSHPSLNPRLRPMLPVIQDESVRLRTWELLPGRLTIWSGLYNETVPSSWIWQHYPDGDKWYQAWKEHGSDAVLKVTNQYLDTSKV